MSATTVPIPPTSRSALAKYWIGIALIVAAGIGLAWWGTADVREKYGDTRSYLADIANDDGVETTDSGLLFKVVRSGEGPSPTDEDIALIGYKGSLRDGTVFDEQPQAPMPVQGVVPGFSEALKKMQKGGKYEIWIPPALGYGAEDRSNPQTGEVVIPGNSVLKFEVELFEFRSRQEIEEMQRQMEEQQGQQGGAAPQGLPPELQRQLEQQLRQQGR